MNGFGDAAGEPFGRELSEALGNEFTQNDREIRHEHDDEDDAGNARRFLGDAELHEPARHGLRERGFADDARENADRSDADLNRRKRARGFLIEFARPGRPRNAVLLHGAQTRLAARHERDLREREDAVEQDEGEKKEKI